MNEKIRELAEQANWLFADKVTGEFTDYDKRIQKFAELIIKECGVALLVGKELRKYDKVTREAAYEELLEHFGVEE